METNKQRQTLVGTNTSDKYYKGSAMLHTIRQVLGDTVFREWLIGLNKKFYHQTINTKQVLDFLNLLTKKDFSKVFEQYLTTTRVPVLQYYFQSEKIYFRWTNCVEGFAMPVKVSIRDNFFQILNPTVMWQSISTLEGTSETLSVDKNFYVRTKCYSETD